MVKLALSFFIMILIEEVKARQIIDSRANPTIEAQVTLSNGITGVASAPSGASKGKTEMLELRDNNPNYLFSKSVLKAVDNVNNIISKHISGMSVFCQFEIDSTIKELDKTPDFSFIGANAAIAVSMAVSVAAANALNIPLYQYLGGINAFTMPIPMINIINGGAHADNKLDFQEFMIVPYGAPSFKEAIKMSLEVFHNLKILLKRKGLSTNVGDEGGFALSINSNSEAFELILEAIAVSNYSSDEIKLALDVASSEFYFDNKYHFENKSLTSDEMINYLMNLCEKYPIISIEDALSQDDYSGWQKISEKMDCMLVGDDLFTTNPRLLKYGIENNIANSILIKPNQIGTVSDTLECVRMAQNNCYRTIISHRSGETENTFISDLSVALNSGFIKTGSLSRVDRVAKYNRLLKIEEILGKSAKYGL